MWLKRLFCLVLLLSGLFVCFVFAGDTPVSSSGSSIWEKLISLPVIRDLVITIVAGLLAKWLRPLLSSQSKINKAKEISVIANALVGELLQLYPKVDAVKYADKIIRKLQSKLDISLETATRAVGNAFTEAGVSPR